MMPKTAKPRHLGFTLIELMLVVAIVALLMVIVVPSYLGNAKKARRAEAKAALTGLTIALERYYMEQSPSTYTGATLGSGSSDIFPNQIPIDAVTKTYNLTLAIESDGTTYTVTASPIGNQQGDDCGNLSINSLGVKGVSSSTVANCWN